MNFSQIIVSTVVLVAAVMAYPNIVKRQAGVFSYHLPAGAELIVGNIRSSFNCQGRRYGYYADVDNNCQIFHVCVPVEHASGVQETFLYSFFCPNQTLFDQSQLICEHEKEANQCALTSEWIYLNEFYNLEDKQFLPRRGILDGRPQGSAASAPTFLRVGRKK